MQTNTENVNELIYSPQRAHKLAIEQLEKFRGQPGSGVLPGLPDLDRKLIPWRAHVVTLQGYTNHFKSTLADIIIKHVADGCEENQIVVKASWEDSIEEQVTRHLSRATQLPIFDILTGKIKDEDWKKVIQKAVKAAQNPVWLIGHSEQAYRARQHPNIYHVWDALDYIVDRQEKRPRMIVLDYFQRIGFHTNDKNSRVNFMKIVDAIADMAIGFGCPVLLVSQTSRQVNDRRVKVPRLEDLQETSNLEQSSRTVLASYLPHKDEPLGAEWSFGGRSFNVTPDLLFLAVLKQKAESPLYKAYHVDYNSLVLTPVTTSKEYDNARTDYLHD